MSGIAGDKGAVQGGNVAKCATCDSRKGKRKCQANGAWICSQCCGEIRDPATCTGCSFFKSAAACRNYRKVPHFSTEQMSEDLDLQSIANVIESAFCTFDVELHDFTDKKASQILEAFFDVCHFYQPEPSFTDPEVKGLYEKMVRIVGEALDDVPAEQLVGVMASIYRSIQRRTLGGRQYLSFVQQYVGPQIAPGVRILPR